MSNCFLAMVLRIGGRMERQKLKVKRQKFRYGFKRDLHGCVFGSAIAMILY